MEKREAEKALNKLLQSKEEVLYEEIGRVVDRLDENKSTITELKSEIGKTNQILESVLEESKKKEIQFEIDPESIKGVDGVNGVDGKDGKDGLNGKDGKDGKDGRDGIDGIDGLDGKDGENGLDGKDGSPDTAEQVRDKLQSLKGNDRLDKSAIKGLEEIDSRGHVGYGPSGVSRIIAGTGVSIASSQENGKGEVTISADADIDLPAGLNTEVQFNDAGSFGADPTFTFNKTTDTLTASNIVATNLYSSSYTYPFYSGYNFFDTTNFTSINFENRNLYDSTGTPSIDWNLRTSFDTSGTNNSINWGTRLLYNTGGVTVADWGISTLYSTNSNISLDWENRYLNDSGGTKAQDWGNRQLFDNAGVLGADYLTAGQFGLYNSTGTGKSTLNSSAISNNWTLTIPDASGTIALTTDIHDFKPQETPTGTIDGVNVTYTLSATPYGNSLLLFRNGQAQEETVDFTISGNTITYTGAGPLVVGERHWAKFQ